MFFLLLPYLSSNPALVTVCALWMSFEHSLLLCLKGILASQTNQLLPSGCFGDLVFSVLRGGL